MGRKIIISFLALISAIGSGIVALEDAPIALASTLEERAAERRLERLQGSSFSSSSSSSSSRSTILRYRTTSSTSSLTLYERVQNRLLERLEDLKLTSPEDYKRVIEMLQRREERKDARQASSEPSVKLQVANAVNMERAKRGIPGLKYHRDLETSAQLHAEDMISRDYFSHENPEGERSGDRIKKTGYGVVNAQECRCSFRVFLGENIAKGQTSVEQVIREWMESDSHREAMLSRDYQDIGVGIANDIWVLNFGSVEINPAE